MFSSRLPWNLAPNRLSRALEARRAAGAEILDLTESNPTHAGIEYPAGLLEAFTDPRGFVYNPSPLGHPEARTAVANYYSGRGIAIDPAQVVLTSSSSESYSYLFKLLCNPGDEILVPRPSYPLFEFLGALESVRIRHYEFSYHGRWWLDTAAVAEAVSPRTRALIVVNPNNPTGSFLKRGELDSLAALARSHDFVLIADEVFSDFAFAADPARVPALADFSGAPAVALSGLSKIAGLPQVKLGWMVVAGPPGFQTAALNRLELIADTYLSVSTPVEYAAAHLLKVASVLRGRIAARTSANLALLRDFICSVPALEILHVEGGWYAVIRVPRTRSEEDWVLGLLESDGVLVQPGFFYDFPSEAYLIVSLLTAPAAFEEGIRRLAARAAAVQLPLP